MSLRIIENFRELDNRILQYVDIWTQWNIFHESHVVIVFCREVPEPPEEQGLYHYEIMASSGQRLPDHQLLCQTPGMYLYLHTILDGSEILHNEKDNQHSQKYLKEQYLFYQLSQWTSGRSSFSHK